MCRKHYLDRIKLRLNEEIKKTYRGPDQAYAALDFEGKGFITKDMFLDSLIVKRLDI